MIIILILSAILAVTVTIYKRINSPDKFWIELATGFSIAALIAWIMVAPINHMATHGEIQQFLSVKETVEYARKLNTIENTALQLQIIEANRWLREEQYWNDTLLDIAIPDEVDNLEPIR